MSDALTSISQAAAQVVVAGAWQGSLVVATVWLGPALPAAGVGGAPICDLERGVFVGDDHAFFRTSWGLWRCEWQVLAVGCGVGNCAGFGLACECDLSRHWTAAAGLAGAADLAKSNAARRAGRDCSSVSRLSSAAGTVCLHRRGCAECYWVFIAAFAASGWTVGADQRCGVAADCACMSVSICGVATTG